MRAMLNEFIRDEDGSTATEYALLGSLLSIICLSAITRLGSTVDEMWGTIETAMTGAANQGGP